MSDNTTNITRDEDITRDEQWLADIRTAAQGGSDYYELDPIIRKEYYYSDIITALKNGGGGGGGTSDYTQLTNKPEINGTTLTGNKTGSDLGLQDKVLGAWTAGTATTHSAPASTDTVLQALEKIDNNQRNDETNILSEQSKTAAMSAGGSDYIVINGVRIYAGATEPTGTIPTGSFWFNSAVN